MSTIALDRLPPEVRSHPPMVTVLDDKRGTAGMWLFVLTESFLFVALFFTYFYLAEGGFTWPSEPLPNLYLAVPIMALFLIGSGVLVWGQRELRRGSAKLARLALGITALLSLGYMVMEAFEFRSDLTSFTPQTNAYGSIFYTILGFHVAHTFLGIFMLAYAMILPELDPTSRPPHRPYYNVALYWHFIVVMWFFTLMFLYVTPYMR